MTQFEGLWLLSIAMLILVIIGVAVAYFKNYFVVENDQRGRTVIRNIFKYREAQNMVVLHQGTHFRMPWWREDTKVALDRKPRHTDIRDSDGHEINTTDEVEVVGRARYNEVAGRKFNPKNGQLAEDAEIDDDVIILAVTETDYEDRQSYVADELSGAFDFVMGKYTYDELMRPDIEEVWVPEKDLTEADDGYDMNKIRVRNRGDLLKEIGMYLERQTNFELRHVGYNVLGVRLTELRGKSPELQAEVDKAKRVRAKMKARKEYGQGTQLTDREMLAQDDQQGMTAIASGMHALAEAAKSGITIQIKK